MIDSRDATTRRLAPSTLPPEVNATRTESSMPNSRNAATTESRVSNVRVRLRNSCAHTNEKYFIAVASVSGQRRVGQLALVQVHRVRGVLGVFGSWVTMMMVLPCSRLSCCSRPRISSADWRSRSPVGSSQIRKVGSETIARAIATRAAAGRRTVHWGDGCGGQPGRPGSARSRHCGGAARH